MHVSHTHTHTLTRSRSRCQQPELDTLSSWRTPSAVSVGVVHTGSECSSPLPPPLQLTSSSQRISVNTTTPAARSSPRLMPHTPNSSGSLRFTSILHARPSDEIPALSSYSNFGYTHPDDDANDSAAFMEAFLKACSSKTYKRHATECLLKANFQDKNSFSAPLPALKASVPT